MNRRICAIPLSRAGALRIEPEKATAGGNELEVLKEMLENDIVQVALGIVLGGAITRYYARQGERQLRLIAEVLLVLTVPDPAKLEIDRGRDGRFRRVSIPGRAVGIGKRKWWIRGPVTWWLRRRDN